MVAETQKWHNMLAVSDRILCQHLILNDGRLIYTNIQKSEDLLIMISDMAIYPKIIPASKSYLQKSRHTRVELLAISNDHSLSSIPINIK